MRWQLESVAVISASFTKERRIDSEYEGRVATGLRSTQQLHCYTSIFVDVKLKEANDVRHKLRYIFDTTCSNGAKRKWNTSSMCSYKTVTSVMCSYCRT